MEPVIFATDFGGESEAALQWAATEAKSRQTTLVMLHCVEVAHDRDRWSYFVERTGYRVDQFRTEALGRLTEWYEESVPDSIKPTHIEYRVEMGRAPDQIRHSADQEGAGLIVLGGAKRNALERLILGSVSEEVVRSATRPVMVVPPDAGVTPVEKIVAPVDFSTCSRASLQVAVDWAERTGAELVALHAFREHARVPPFGVHDDIDEPEVQRRRAKRRLRAMAGEFSSPEVEIEARLEDGAPEEIIRRTADRMEAELIVMGTQGRRGLERFMVGSTAIQVLRGAERPIVTVFERGDEEPGG